MKKENYEEYEENKKTSIWPVLIAVFVLVLVLGIIASFIIPSSYVVTQEYPVKEPRQERQVYYGDEPFTNTKCNMVNMLFSADVNQYDSRCIQDECSNTETYCYSKNWLGNCVEYRQRCIGTSCVKYSISCKLKIVNKERVSGKFVIGYGKWDYDDNEFKKIGSDYIWVNALDEGYKYWSFNKLTTESLGCYATWDTPQRQECKDFIDYRKVKKEKDVTVYYDSTKTRQVTKYAPLFMIWTGQVRYYEYVSG